MKIEILIPDYSVERGLIYEWENGFIIKTEKTSNSIKILANKEGLLSLANHFINLSQDSVPIGHHLHFDEFSALEDGSVDLIIEKL